MSENTYTPSIDEIRDAWAGARGGYENEPRYRAREAEFDRWLAAHDAELIEKLADEYEAQPEGERVYFPKIVGDWLRSQAAELRKEQDRG